MSRHRFMVMVGMLGLVMGVGTAASKGPSTENPWKTIAAAGRVESLSPAPTRQDWLPVRRGSEVAPLSHVRTLQRASTTLTRQGDLILVAADSEVVLPDRRPDGTTVVLQQTGHAIYKVAPRTGGGRFEVKTPFLVAGVKGTRFSVILEKDRAAVSVLEGVVEVRSTATGEKTDLTAGMVAVVGGALGRIETYDASGQNGEQKRPGREERQKTEGHTAEPANDTKENVKGTLGDTLRTSEKLAASLVETDDSLKQLDKKADDDLWGDLLDDHKSVARSNTGAQDQKTAKLDPIASDPKSDPSLITRLIDLLKGR